LNIGVAALWSPKRILHIFPQINEVERIYGEPVSYSLSHMGPRLWVFHNDSERVIQQGMDSRQLDPCHLKGLTKCSGEWTVPNKEEIMEVEGSGCVERDRRKEANISVGILESDAKLLSSRVFFTFSRAQRCSELRGIPRW